MRYRAFLLAERFYPMPVAAPSPPPGDPWAELEWHNHPEAIDAVRRHPEGMTLEQIGKAMKITRERVRQIESGALRKLIDNVRRDVGTEVIEIGGHTFRCPDCERCGQAFVPRNGSERMCEVCIDGRGRRQPVRRH